MTTAQGSGKDDTLITGDELARMRDHELTELIDGRIVPLSPTNPEHGRLEANVAGAIRDFARTQNLGLVRGADVVFISHAQYDRRTKTRGFFDVAPELVVEILSPERPDTEQKVIEYLAIGVRLVLVVDPDARTISVRRQHGAVSQYGERDTVPCDEAIPGFSLPIADVFT